MKDGDGTVQSKQLNPKSGAPDDPVGRLVDGTKAMLLNVREIKDSLNGLMDNNEKSLKEALVPVPQIGKD